VSNEDGDRGILGEEIWSQKWGHQDQSTPGGRWSRRLKTGLQMDGVKWYVACASLGAPRHKSRQVKSIGWLQLEAEPEYFCSIRTCKAREAVIPYYAVVSK